MLTEKLLSASMWSSRCVLKLRTATVTGQAALSRVSMSIIAIKGKGNWMYLPTSNLFSIDVCCLGSPVTRGMLPCFHYIPCTRDTWEHSMHPGMGTDRWVGGDPAGGDISFRCTAVPSMNDQPQKWGPTVACLIRGLKVQAVTVTFLRHNEESFLIARNKCNWGENWDKVNKNSAENLNKVWDLHFSVAWRDEIDLVQMALGVCFCQFQSYAGSSTSSKLTRCFWALVTINKIIQEANSVQQIEENEEKKGKHRI